MAEAERLEFSKMSESKFVSIITFERQVT